MKKLLPCFTFTLVFITSAIGLSATKVKVLNWWDFMTGETISRLKSAGFEIDITIYKSNDVAVGKLISNPDKFDIAIVSNILLRPLKEADILQPMSFDQKRLRKYVDLFSKNVEGCVPYMWSTTVFAVNDDANAKPKSISELVSLKEKGYKLGLIDDKIEILSRIVGDWPNCRIRSNPTLLDALSSCGLGAVASFKKAVSPQDFRSSVYEVLKSKPSAAYGWHGEIADEKSDSKNLQVTIPERPTVGFDAACIVKKKRTKLQSTKLAKFLEILTDRKSVASLAKQYQYFSPFKDDVRHLTPKVREVRRQVLRKISLGEHVILTNPSNADQSKLNSIWREVRYNR